MRDYGKILKQDRGMRVNWAAEKLGIPESTLSMKLLGYRRLTEEDVKKLDKLLNLKPLKDGSKNEQNRIYRQRTAQGKSRPNNQQTNS